MSVLEVENRNGALWVTFNRPEAYNSMCPETIARLMDAWDQAENDNSIRVVVFTGKGEKAFCTGADLKLLMPLMTGARPPETEAEHKVMSHPNFVSKIMQRNRTFCKPIVTAINGVAMGGGCEMVIASDIRIASSNATFALSEPKVGVVAAAGSLVRLSRQIPWCQAMEFLLTGDTISAEDAVKLGLINRVVAPEALISEVEKLVEKLLRNAPLALQTIKKTAVMSSGVDLDEAFSIEDIESLKVLRSEDAREGPRAFAEKRPPNFQGK